MWRVDDWKVNVLTMRRSRKGNQSGRGRGQHGSELREVVGGQSTGQLREGSNNGCPIQPGSNMCGKQKTPKESSPSEDRLEAEGTLEAQSMRPVS
jgi:hypothetical protein